MSDFLQERAAAGKAKKPRLPKAKTRLAEIGTPRAPKRKRKRNRELEELIRDFRLGLTSLRGLTQRLHTERANYVNQRGAKPPAPPAVTKIVERERHVIERLLTGLPTKERELILREYERRTQGIMSAQVPQAYAALLRGAELLQPTTTGQRDRAVKPAAVMRPDQPRVRELMATAKAIRSGRLPFLPKEVIERSRELLTVMFGKDRARELMTSRDVVTRKLISQQRLIPRSVRAAISVTPKRRMTRVQQELQKLLTRSVAPQHAKLPAQQLSPVELAQLEPVLPAMHTGGAAGSGEYRMQAGEDVHVITRNDALMNVPSPGASGTAPKPEVTTGKFPADGTAPVNVAPVPASSVTPKKADVAKASTPFSRPTSARAEFGASGSAQGSQTLQVKDIEGLATWMGQTEERLGNLDV